MEKHWQYLAAWGGAKHLHWQNRLTGAISRANQDEEGAATAEYAITTLAAAAFAGLLLAIFKSGSVKDLLLGIIKSALSVG